MMAFGVIALMLFGSKLPEVARNFGASYRELRKHLDSFQREFQNWEHSEPVAKKPASLRKQSESSQRHQSSYRLHRPKKPSEFCVMLRYDARLLGCIYTELTRH